MATQKPLSRAQLAKFLPDAESIRAFENLFVTAGETTPTSLEELELLINGLRYRFQSSISALSELENLQPRAVNFSGIESRLAELEIQASKRQSYDALLRRVEDLEKLVGV